MLTVRARADSSPLESSVPERKNFHGAVIAPAGLAVDEKVPAAVRPDVSHGDGLKGLAVVILHGGTLGNRGGRPTDSGVACDANALMIFMRILFAL
jgi:hypothetical protein